MRVHNTLTRRLEEVEPIEAGHVRLYTCGPTVHDYAHIGNFRAFLFEDVLRRGLRFGGLRVTQVMNLTDVDDKTIRGSRKAGVSLDAYTRPFKDAFFADLKTLRAEAAEVYPAATDHIPEMIALVERLLAGGFAYRSEDRSVYFNVRRFPGYGKLAHLDVEGLKAGVRVAQDEYEKDHVADFALWKAWDEADGDVAWDSPWGRGRPGWHLECSAMSMKYLGESFDIHTGGVDNMFPHHENEIAQSEAATGRPFVRYWMHSAHLVVNGTKMAKSLGNFLTLRDLLGRGYAGREVRYVLLSGHYRQTLNFTMDGLDAARGALRRLDEFQTRLAEAAGSASAAGELPDWARRGREAFAKSLQEDLGMPEALAAVFEMARQGHRAMDAGDLAPGQALAVIDLMADLDRVLGVLAEDEAGPDGTVQGLVAERDRARKARQWAESDRLRAELAARGWAVQDTPQGTKVRRAAGRKRVV